ncbi:PadR family transcriptional regulator [Actinocrispum wychmicini]|uniref:PadR family transcriptional regulator n=1 Tax=Actinocrispum wychmicini TaxID=1213861 RepID=A0A4R2JRB6_9PSEU|nr:PadR family transcriptional regulator [Actinocrispum wychmicini]TCO59758.1 PadR family transcriptional regulator [Actinocrispum wychmicini]
MPPQFRPSPLALAVLGLLEAGPLHPYGMQRLIKQWGKDQVINVGQRTSLYRTIARLEQAGLIAAVGTDRDERYPERTTYEVTDTGRVTTRLWLAEMVATPRNEFPEFPAALSFLMLLSPDEVRLLLAERRQSLTQRLAELDVDLATEIEGYQLPRVTLVETEYLRAVTDAELRWTTEILAALDDGSLTWSREELEALAAIDQS